MFSKVIQIATLGTVMRKTQNGADSCVTDVKLALYPQIVDTHCNVKKKTIRYTKLLFAF